MPRSFVRTVNDYPPVYFYVIRRIAIKAVPTLNDEFDDPPRSGPFNQPNSVKIYRATFHNFRERLRADSPLGSPGKQMFNIISNLTTKTVSTLKADGTVEYWIEFAPHPFMLAEWRASPELFEAEKRRHANFVASLQNQC
jgi:hypothetical protein